MNNSYGWDVSVIDSNNYMETCKKIAEDDSEFETFKSNSKYQVILEHVDENLGSQYYNHIIKVGKDIFESHFEQFCENDSIGNPVLSFYDDKGISPTTLRYVKNCFDLSSLCAEYDIKKIVEVGGGYGGLCKTLSVLCDFEKYIQVDLPQAIKVQEKYLKNFPEVFSKVEFCPCNSLEDITDVDLFISNYALSELNIETQINYYQKIIKNSKIVYITYNSIINANSNYNTFLTMLKEDGFELQDAYKDYGYHKNIIIAAKR
jgi:putative sugar O-methyltransferase